ncbi:MAG: SDR family NAD(P)-dependent oxidoreductase [Cyanobacteria bacterium J06656_5]
MGLFIQELGQIYDSICCGQSISLSKLPIQYADFALWQHQQLQGDLASKQLNYWKKQLANSDFYLALPTDKSRPALQTYKGNTLSLELSESLTQQLKALAQAEDCTLYMVLLSAFNILLYRYSGQKDILVGTPVANRNRAEIEGLIGFFVNTLIMRTDLSGDPSFRTLLKRVREMTSGAYAHQDLPFEKIVDELQPDRDLSYQPIVQVLFGLQNVPLGTMELADITLKPLAVDSGSARFDLILLIWEVDNRLTVFFEYSTDIFEAATIARLQKHFQRLLEEIVAKPSENILALPLLSTSEQQQLLVEWQPSLPNNPTDIGLIQAFEDQVQKSPQSIAVTVDTQQVTYHQLNCRINQLAGYLQTSGVELGDIVGVYLPPSIDWVVAVLATLKAGGVYLPLDLTESSELLAFKLDQNPPKILLTHQSLRSNLSEKTANVIELDITGKTIQQQPENDSSTLLPSNEPCCLYYCGDHSTQVTYHALNQRLAWLQQEFSISNQDIFLCQGQSSLDCIIREIMLPLSRGAEVVIATDCPSSLEFSKLIAEHKVSVINFYASSLSLFLSSASHPLAANFLRFVWCSGEPLPSATANHFCHSFKVPLYYLHQAPQLFGELTVQACHGDHPKQFVPIGQPAYREIYVLDETLNPAPIGIQGTVFLRSQGSQTLEMLGKDQVIKTGDFGRWLHDGTLECLGCESRGFWHRGDYFNLDAVEAVLLELPDVKDSTVLLRETADHGQKLVAYVVPASSANRDQLARHLQKYFARWSLPYTWQFLSSLPMTVQGQIDVHALMQLAVIDDDLLRRWQNSLQTMSQIDRVTVVKQDILTDIPLLHLADVLPDRNVVVPSNEAPHPGISPGIQTSEPLTNKLAISDGGPLQPEVLTARTLQDVLERAAHHASNKGILYLEADGHETVQAYSALLRDAQQTLAGFRALGLKPHDKVIFQLDDNQQFITAFWGCLLGGFVPVPLSVAPTYRESNSAIDKLYHAWQLFGQPVIVTSERLTSDLETLPKIVDMAGLRLAEMEQLLRSEPDLQWHPSQPDDLALLLLTSGSTGTPKAVMHTHQSLLSHCVGDGAYTQFSASEVTLNWFPLDHVGGIVMFHLRDIYLGCEQIHAPTQRVLQDPLIWLDWLHRYHVTVTWAPNFAYSLVNEKVATVVDKSWDLSALRFILNAGEAIVAKTARRFLELLQPYGLPATAMRPAWGMSETSSAVVYSATFSRGSTTDEQTFVEVGGPIPGLKIRIVDADNQVVAAETTGRLQVKGDMVTLGYYAQPELTNGVLSTEGWFDTGDLGFLRQGKLTLTGRQKDIIIVNGANFYNHEIETVVEAVPGVEISFTAACAVRLHDSQTDQLAVFFNSKLAEPQILLNQLQEIRQALVTQMGINPTYLVPLNQADIPKTAIGKIQRTQLQRRFEAGEFDPVLKRIDLLSANDNTLPNWFYRRLWTPKQLRYVSTLSLSGSILIFMDDVGLGEHLCQQFDQAAVSYIKVSKASSFECYSLEHYGINPQHPQSYHRLLDALRTAQLNITTVLHLGGYQDYAEDLLNSHETLRMTQFQGTYSLLFLIQALAQGRETTHPATRLMVVTAKLQATHSNEPTCCIHGTLSGLLQTIPLELSWLSCQHLDLPSSTASAQQANFILDELAHPGVDTEIAYRQNQRWVASLASIDWKETPRQPIHLKTGGLYLITGGLGGIATALARNLYEDKQVKLLLVGRTALPPRHEWIQHLEQDTPVAYKIRQLQAIESITNKVMYHAVDVCDAEALEQLVDNAEHRWQQPLDGVFHLAGEGNLGQHWQSVDERWLTAETVDAIEWMWRAKVYGTCAIARQLLANRPNALFVGFSSVNALFGGTTFSAYAAANSFMDHFCHYQRTHGHPNTYSINWSMWQELGMSEGAPEATLKVSQQLGYYMLSKAQGWYSLQACLSAPPAQYIVGLDRHKSNVQDRCQVECKMLQNVAAFYTRNGDLPITRLQQLKISDTFAKVSQCNFVEVDSSVFSSNGEINETALNKLKSPQPSQKVDDYIAPSGEIEEAIAAIWQEILGVEKIAVNQNFFELGGSSILTIQVISKIQTITDKSLSVVDIFQYPTISLLTKYLSKAQVNCEAKQKTRQKAKNRKDLLKKQMNLHRRSRLKKVRS